MVLEHRVKFWITVGEEEVVATVTVESDAEGYEAINAANRAMNEATGRLKKHLRHLTSSELEVEDRYGYVTRPLDEVLNSVVSERCSAVIRPELQDQLLTSEELLMALEHHSKLYDLGAEREGRMITAWGSPTRDWSVVDAVASLVGEEASASTHAARLPPVASHRGWRLLIPWLLFLMLGSWFLTISWLTITAMAVSAAVPIGFVIARSRAQARPRPRPETAAVAALAVVGIFGLVYAVCVSAEPGAITLANGDPVTQIGDAQFISAGVSATGGTFDATLRHGAKIVAHVQILVLLSIAVPVVGVVLLRILRAVRRLDAGRFEVN